MSQACTVCLSSIGSLSWTLPCNHIFHPRCIKALYDANINKIDEETFEKFIPMCPNCRRVIHRRDLPPRQKSAIDHELVQQPAISAMPVEQRPLRLAREQIVVARARTRSLLDELVQRRERLRRGQVEPMPGTSGESNSRENNMNVSGSFQCHSSSSSQESQDPPKSQASDKSRSRSPLSQKAPSPFVRQSQELQKEGMYISSSAALLLHQIPDLQEVQMQITILENQLRAADQLPARTQPLDKIELSDNESVASEDEDPVTRQPVDIVGDIGRGQNIKYVIKWSDGTETLNRTRDVQRCAPVLLEIYRRRIRARNTRICREKKKAVRTSAQNARD